MKQPGKKAVLIVGPGADLGMELARKFGENGYAVILMGRNKETLAARANLLNATGVETYPLQVDVADPESMEKAFRQADELPCRLSGLVYNAVARRTKSPSGLSVDEVAEDLKVNLLGAVGCVGQMLARLKTARDGFIAFTGGGVALSPSVPAASMSLGKAALRNYALNLAEELKESPVFVGTVTITRKIARGTECDPAEVAARFSTMVQERSAREIIF